MKVHDERNAPLDGQAALDNSIPLSDDGEWRLGISCGQFVVLCRTRSGFFQGYVVGWNEINKQAQAELIRRGWTDSTGTLLRDELKY